MRAIEEGHPCAGKDCINCETCIFDRDLFLDKVTPNEKKDMNQTSKLCNDCVNLVKDYSDSPMADTFDARCKADKFPHIGGSHNRLIDCNLTKSNSICRPSWCPLNANRPAGLPAPSQVSHRPTPQTTGPSSSTNSYTEKRERLKSLPKHLEWDELKEGEIYIIPRIMYQGKKIVRIITKTQYCCSCKEIGEDGREYAYNTTFYPSDIEAVLINKLHNF